MSQKRKALRAAMVSQIGTGTRAGANVFSNRPTPFRSEELPAVFVYMTDGEQSEQITDQAAEGLLATAKIGVECRIQISPDSAETLDDDLDDFATEVETQIRQDRTFGGIATKAERILTDMDTSYEGERAIGAILLTFEVIYRED